MRLVVGLVTEAGVARGDRCTPVVSVSSTWVGTMQPARPDPADITEP